MPSCSSARSRPVRPKSGLDFIEDQHDVVAVADLSRGLEVAGRWNDNPGFTLDGLYQKTGGVGGDGRFQGIGIAEGDDFESRGERAESGAGPWGPWRTPRW